MRPAGQRFEISHQLASWVQRGQNPVGSTEEGRTLLGAPRSEANWESLPVGACAQVGSSTLR